MKREDDEEEEGRRRRRDDDESHWKAKTAAVQLTLAATQLC